MRHSSRPPIAATVVTVAVALAGLVLVPAATAHADPPQFDPGSGLPTVGGFSPVSLNGTDQLSSATIAPFVIIDNSGAFAGWHVTLLVPPLADGTGADCSTAPTDTIPAVDLSMSAPVVTAGDGTTSMSGVTTEGFTDFSTPRTIIAAATGFGAGTYDVAPEILKLIVPADTLTGAYCTQATIAITSGP